MTRRSFVVELEVSEWTMPEGNIDALTEALRFFHLQSITYLGTPAPEDEGDDPQDDGDDGDQEEDRPEFVVTDCEIEEDEHGGSFLTMTLTRVSEDPCH